MGRRLFYFILLLLLFFVVVNFAIYKVQWRSLLTHVLSNIDVTTCSTVVCKNRVLPKLNGNASIQSRYFSLLWYSLKFCFAKTRKINVEKLFSRNDFWMLVFQTCVITARLMIQKKNNKRGTAQDNQKCSKLQNKIRYLKIWTRL